jgi:hypothetical protein
VLTADISGDRLNEFRRTIDVMGILTDIDQVTGERYVRIDFGMQLSTPPQTTPRTMTTFPAPNLLYWRFVLSLFVPLSEWKNQYKMGEI